MDLDVWDEIAGLSDPARRALRNAGYERLEQLTGVAVRDLASLHGIGPKAIRILGEQLAEHGRAFAD